MAIDDDIMAKIDGINASKQAIIEAIKNKGYPVPKDATLAELRSFVNLIQIEKPALDTCETPYQSSFIIPYGVKTVSADEVSRHTGMIVFPNSVTKITNGYEGSSVSATRIVLSDSIEEIGDNAFRMNTVETSHETMANITFPRSLKKIGESAFRFYVKNSMEVSLRGTLLEEYGNCAINPMSYNGHFFSFSLIIPSTIKHIAENAFLVDNMAWPLEITIDKTKEEVKSMEGYPFSTPARRPTFHCLDGDI